MNLFLYFLLYYKLYEFVAIKNIASNFSYSPILYY